MRKTGKNEKPIDLMNLMLDRSKTGGSRGGKRNGKPMFLLVAAASNAVEASV